MIGLLIFFDSYMLLIFFFVYLLLSILKDCGQRKTEEEDSNRGRGDGERLGMQRGARERKKTSTARGSREEEDFSVLSV